MKKKVIALALSAVVSLSAFTFVGCGDDKKTEEKPKSEQTQKEEPKKEDPKKEDPKKDEEKVDTEMTAEKWIANPLVQARLKQESQGKYEISAKGNSITYTFKQEQAGLTAQDIKAYLETQESTFQTIGTQLKQEMKVKELDFILKYTNPDGSELYSHTIKVK